MKKLLILLFIASLSYAQGIKTIAVPMLFDTATTSETVDLVSYQNLGYRICGVQLDTVYKSSAVAFKVSADGVKYGDLKNEDNATLGITVTAGTWNLHKLTPNEYLPINSIYAVSDSTETGTLKLILWKEE